MVLNHGSVRYYRAHAGADGLLSKEDYAKLATWPVVRLTYAATTDLLNGAAVLAGAWNNVNADQNFVSSGSSARFAIAIRAGVHYTAAAATNGALRVMLDGVTTVPLSAGWAAAGTFHNLQGGALQLSGFSAGTHTIRVQVNTGGNATVYCRALTVPTYEFLRIDITELSP